MLLYQATLVVFAAIAAATYTDPSSRFGHSHTTYFYKEPEVPSLPSKYCTDVCDVEAWDKKAVILCEFPDYCKYATLPGFYLCRKGCTPTPKPEVPKLPAKYCTDVCDGEMYDKKIVILCDEFPDFCKYALKPATYLCEKGCPPVVPVVPDPTADPVDPVDPTDTVEDPVEDPVDPVTDPEPEDPTLPEIFCTDVCVGGEIDKKVAILCTQFPDFCNLSTLATEVLCGRGCATPEDPTTDPVEDPATDPVEDPATDPVEDPATDPVEDPVDPVTDPEPEVPTLPEIFCTDVCVGGEVDKKVAILCTDFPDFCNISTLATEVLCARGCAAPEDPTPVTRGDPSPSPDEEERKLPRRFCQSICFRRLFERKEQILTEVGFVDLLDIDVVELCTGSASYSCGFCTLDDADVEGNDGIPTIKPCDQI